nr:glycosyltransferase family 4 protein [Bacteroidota bacterium]
LNSIKPDLILLKTPRSLLLCLSIYRRFSDSIIIKLTAHDSDFHIFGNWHQKLIYKAGMFAVDHYIYQSDYQKSIGDKQKLNGTTIKNILHAASINKKDDSFKTDVLWVGKNIRRKNPELLIRIAEFMPEYRFIMISAEGDNHAYNEKIRDSASLVSNLTYIGPVEYDKTWRYFNNTRLLLHTSDSEGFPNVFLQAWQCEVPVISFNIDIDYVIQTNKIGLVAHSFEELIKKTNGMLKDTKRRKEYGKRAKQYVKQAHDSEYIASNYLKLFNQLIVNDY